MRIINLIFRAFSTLKASTYLRLYKAFVLPILEYLSPIWNPSDIGSIQKLESIQRKFTKRLFYRVGKPKISYESRLKKLSLCSLKQRRLLTDLVTFYKILHGQIETPKALFTGAPSISRTRGHRKRIQYTNTPMAHFAPLLQLSFCEFARGNPSKALPCYRAALL